MLNKNEINKLCKSGNTSEARAAILTMLDSDRFRIDMLVPEIMSSSEVKGLFVDDNQIPLEKEGWNYEYWTMMCIELSNNFSREKLKHIIDVMVALKKIKDAKFISVRSTQDKLPKIRAKRKEVIGNEDSYFDKTVKRIGRLDKVMHMKTVIRGWKNE